MLLQDLFPVLVVIFFDLRCVYGASGSPDYWRTPRRLCICGSMSWVASGETAVTTRLIRTYDASEGKRHRLVSFFQDIHRRLYSGPVGALVAAEVQGVSSEHDEYGARASSCQGQKV